MKNGEKTRELLMRHYLAYPQLQIRDIFKYLFQSSFGCEHMSPSLQAAIEYIRAEYTACRNEDGATIDILDGNYSRVHLSYLNKGLSQETLGKLFCASAKHEPTGKAELLQKLQITKELITEGLLPFCVNDFENAVKEWAERGYRALHHSDIFRAAYHPAYRVIANEYIPFLPLFAKIDDMLMQGSVTVAIEGGSASGKTTLSETLGKLYDCTVFHMDDFFLRPEQRTPERRSEIGGNVDRERFLKEVLLPLRAKKPIRYQRFDCSSQTLDPPITKIPKQLTIVEGAYSMHPELEKYYHLSVFLDIDPETQKKRIEKRNTPPMAKRFFDEWIPLERIYFSKTEAKKRCELCIDIAQDFQKN